MQKINEHGNVNAEELGIAFWNFLIEKRLIQEISTKLEKLSNEVPEAVSLLNWINKSHENLQTLILGKPEQLESIIDELDEMPDSKRLLNVFNYAKFRREFAFEFYEKWLDVPVCAYCNRNYTDIVKVGKSGKLAYTFDHFFSKSKYPYLALSFFNLIPCCSVCNSIWKGSTEFCLQMYLHPWVDSFHQHVKFILTPNVVGGGHPLFWSVDLAPQVIKNESMWMKAYRLAAVLHLDKHYQRHAALVQEMVQLRDAYPDDYLDSLVKNHPEIFESRNALLKKLVTKPNVAQISKRPLGKLIYDLYDQLWESNP